LRGLCAKGTTGNARTDTRDADGLDTPKDCPGKAGHDGSGETRRQGQARATRGEDCNVVGTGPSHAGTVQTACDACCAAYA